MSVTELGQTVGDRYMYLSTTNMYTGYVIETLLSLESYKSKKNPKSLRPTTKECKAFINDFIATLESRPDVPFAMRRLAGYYESTSMQDQIQNWTKTKQALEFAEKGQDVEDIEHVLSFLRNTAEDFNEVRRTIRERLHESRPSREYL